MTRRNVLNEAVENCFKELYSFVQPSIEWDEFVKENKNYSDRCKVWERYNYLCHKENKSEEELKEYSTYPITKWKDKSITECIGPRPYEFYYLSKDILKDICDSYVDAYRLNEKQELLNTITTLKDYCKNPIIDKYIEGELQKDGTQSPGYKGYEYPDNLEKELFDLLPDSGFDKSELTKAILGKFFKFLDMAGDFYEWTGDLNSFNMSVYLGASPNSNKKAVIKNWKEYRKKDIVIDEEKMKNDYYGDDE